MVIRNPVKIIRHPVRQPVKSSVVEFDMQGLLYLEQLIKSKEPLIFLYGGNPCITQIRNFSSYEKINHKHWIMRTEAHKQLKEALYFKKGRMIDGNKIPSEVWQLRNGV